MKVMVVGVVVDLVTVEEEAEAESTVVETAAVAVGVVVKAEELG